MRGDEGEVVVVVVVVAVMVVVGGSSRSGNQLGLCEMMTSPRVSFRPILRNGEEC